MSSETCEGCDADVTNNETHYLCASCWSKYQTLVGGAYKVAITNVALYIRSRRNTSCEDGPLDGFTASSVLSIAFCKAKEEVLADILNVKAR